MKQLFLICSFILTFSSSVFAGECFYAVSSSCQSHVDNSWIQIDVLLSTNANENDNGNCFDSSMVELTFVDKVRNDGWYDKACPGEGHPEIYENTFAILQSSEEEARDAAIDSHDKCMSASYTSSCYSDKNFGVVDLHIE